VIGPVFDIDPVLNSIQGKLIIRDTRIRAIGIYAAGRKKKDFYCSFNAIAGAIFRDSGDAKGVVKRSGAFINKKDIVFRILVCAADIAIAIFKPESHNQGVFLENALFKCVL
jgi:hypothetical protein